MPVKFYLDLDEPEVELEKQEVSELATLTTNLEYEGILSDYGRGLRHVILYNFYLQLCYLLVVKKVSKVLKNMTAFRPIFVQLWYVMLQSFITERAIEIKTQKQETDAEVQRLQALYRQALKERAGKNIVEKKDNTVVDQKVLKTKKN